jgi:hypothetical protein
MAIMGGAQTQIFDGLWRFGRWILLAAGIFLQSVDANNFSSLGGLFQPRQGLPDFHRPGPIGRQ